MDISPIRAVRLTWKVYNVEISPEEIPNGTAETKPNTPLQTVTPLPWPDPYFPRPRSPLLLGLLLQRFIPSSADVGWPTERASTTRSADESRTGLPKWTRNRQNDEHNSPNCMKMLFLNVLDVILYIYFLLVDTFYIFNSLDHPVDEKCWELQRLTPKWTFKIQKL